ncbi:MAG: tyrosine-protein phosphatase [Lacrimispora sp.]|uniref:tyrosine-protein phosphatase n=1 Tax=Lacrimispora sp. TaxID=2719234 RepID=UPI0039E5B36F
MKVYEQPYTIPGISVQREGDELTVALEAVKPSDYQLYMGSSPQAEAITQPAAKSRDGVFHLTLPAENGPCYFMIKAQDFQTNIFSERVLQLKEAINVRDMGGYETEAGKFVKWGLLYRGDQLSKLVPEDISMLERIGLTTLVDYRSDHERTINPNKEIRTVKNLLHCDPQSSFSESAANAIDLHSENVKLVNSLENGEVEEKYLNGKGEKVILSYRDLVTAETAKKAYGQFLHACADKKNLPLLHHCRGGKDRTGFASMLLLLLLGVKREDIIEDYILTGIIRKERNQLKYEQYRELTSNQNHLDYLMALIETRREYIEASMDRIYELYDSVEDYMIQHFELTKEQIETMKSFYLEEGSAVWDR